MTRVLLNSTANRLAHAQCQSLGSLNIGRWALLQDIQTSTPEETNPIRDGNKIMKRLSLIRFFLTAQFL